MDFELSEEQRIIRKTVSDFAANELAPIADELDAKEEFPWAVFKRLRELGLFGMMVPTEYGGSDAGELSLAIAIEEIAKACASTADIVDSAAIIGTLPILHYGTPEQKVRYLPLLATGEKISAYAVTEPDAGSDIGSIRTKAVKDGDAYVLNGQKTFITNGNVCDMAVIFAGVPELAPRGMTAFLVEYGTSGFTKGKQFRKLGMKAATNCELFFEDCRIPSSNILGQEGQGMKIALATLDHGRIGIAAQAVGIAQVVLEKSAEYARTRVQFGAPISKNQAISGMVADMATEIEAARFLYYHAAYLAEKGKPFTTNAAMAKLYASELAMRASTAGIQIFGGYGYMMEYPMQRYFRDAKLTEIYEGTSEVQRLVISRSVLA